MIGERAVTDVGEGGPIGGREIDRHRMDQVDHDAGEREVAVAQCADEMLGLTDRLGPRTRHDDERRSLRPQQHRHLAGALTKAGFDVGE